MEPEMARRGTAEVDEQEQLNQSKEGERFALLLAFACSPQGQQEDEEEGSAEEDDGRAARSHLYISFPFFLLVVVVESWQRLAGPACQWWPEATSKRAGLTSSASWAHLSLGRIVTTAGMRCGGRGDPVRLVAPFPSLTVKKNAVACGSDEFLQMKSPTRAGRKYSV